jgi:uncharacterized OsmC-like protein
MVIRLASAVVTARLLSLPGVAVATAKNHHFIVDSPLHLGGPNEEINPVDLLLSALATHSAFVCERAAQENGLTLKGLSVRVTGEFDPVGAPDRGTVPYFNSIKMQLQLSEGSASDAEHLAEAIKTRCLIYATLARAVPIRLEIANETNAAASHSLS